MKGKEAVALVPFKCFFFLLVCLEPDSCFGAFPTMKTWQHHHGLGGSKRKKSAALPTSQMFPFRTETIPLLDQESRAAFRSSLPRQAAASLSLSLRQPNPGDIRDNQRNTVGLSLNPSRASKSGLFLLGSETIMKHVKSWFVSFRSSLSGTHRSIIAATAGALATLLMLPLVISIVLPHLRNAVSRRLMPLLWPNSKYDANRHEPLPPGSMGFPVLGRPFFWGSSEWGSGSFYRKAAKQLGWPRLFKYYFLGCPFVSVSGLRNVQYVLNKEFEKPSGIKTALYLNELLGRQSLAGDLSRDQHQFLRRLVGQSLAPAAVALSLPFLECMAMEQIHKLLREAQENPVSMDRVVTEYTLNIAWKQILGLDLAEGEVPEFCAAVNRWIRGLVSARAYLGYKVSESDGYRALQYLEARVGNKIDELERTGPDGVSALSGMVFATDDDKEVTGDLGGGSQEKSKRKLSRKEVIDNALLLVLAGSETASSTLANAVLMLGLHRDAWRKLVEEQRQVRESYGEALTMRALDKDAAPYLDAVIKEALRIRPLSITFPRVATDTLVVEGRQIPRGWFVDWNAVLTHELDPVTFQSDGSHMDILKGFRPERWLSDVTAPSEFIPFGQGPRYCLGSHLAYAEMKVFLSLLARNVDFELSGRNKMKVVWKHASLIAKVKDALPVIVQPAVPSQLRNSSYA